CVLFPPKRLRPPQRAGERVGVDRGLVPRELPGARPPPGPDRAATGIEQGAEGRFVPLPPLLLPPLPCRRSAGVDAGQLDRQRRLPLRPRLLTRPDPYRLSRANRPRMLRRTRTRRGSSLGSCGRDHSAAAPAPESSAAADGGHA